MKIVKPKIKVYEEKSFDECNLSENIYNTLIEKNTQKIKLSNITIDSCIIKNIDFSDIDLENIDLIDVVFENCKINNVGRIDSNTGTAENNYNIYFKNCKFEYIEDIGKISIKFINKKLDNNEFSDNYKYRIDYLDQ